MYLKNYNCYYNTQCIVTDKGSTRITSFVAYSAMATRNKMLNNNYTNKGVCPIDMQIKVLNHDYKISMLNHNYAKLEFFVLRLTLIND